MGDGIDTTIFAAFGVGMLSFFSPCVLPLVPGYLSAVSGVSAAEIGERGSAKQVLGPAMLFCLAFTVVFVAFGLTATALGQSLATNRATLEKISGAFIVAMGLFMGFSLISPKLNRDFRPERLIHAAGAGGPLVAGAAFAIAWTPCVGPTLGAILTAAGTKENVGSGAVLLLFYSAGLAVPFIGSALGVGVLSNTNGWVKRHYPWIVGISAVLLIVIGVLIFTDQFTLLNNQAQRLTRDLNLTF